MRSLPLLATISLIGPLASQSNTIAGLNAAVTSIDSATYLGRRGAAYPDGEIALAFANSTCNIGLTQISWDGPGAGPAPMGANHPTIAFLVAREADGRLVQITGDATFLRHVANAGNGSSCGLCVDPLTGALLGVACSDVTAAATNGDRYWLAPLSEVDPWLGTWNPVGSYFDRGDPEVTFPENQDGVRSLDGIFADEVQNRIAVRESDLQPAGRYFYSMQMVVPGEDAENRIDNIAWRETTPAWNGSTWDFTDVGAVRFGSVLQAWQGAAVSGARNGEADGLLVVGVKVTGPVAGLYHYEYAVHDVDNLRGAASLRIPLCTGVQVLNSGFRDLDLDPLNDWTVSRSSTELVFQAGANNPLRWNQIFNFWFDSDSPPLQGAVALDQALPGAGAPQISINSQVPGSAVAIASMGPGCGDPSPTLAADGIPVLGNSGFGLTLVSSPDAPMFLLVSLDSAGLPLGNGCTQYVGPATLASHAFLLADPAGFARAPLPVPNSTALDGLVLYWQAAQLVTGGPVLDAFTVSNGLLTRLGCPAAAAEILQFSGYETGDLGECSFSMPGASVQNVVVRSGNFAMRGFTPIEGYSHATLTRQSDSGANDAPLDLANLYVSFYFRYTVATLRSRIAEVGGLNGATKARLELEVDRRLSINDWLHTHRFHTQTSLQPDRWYRIRWYVGTGLVARTMLMIDDVVEIDESQATLSNEPAMRFHAGRSSQSGGLFDFYIDDVVISRHAFADDGEIVLLKPNGPGDQSSWSGTFDDVDDWPHDGDLTASISAGSGTSSTFALTDADTAGITGRVLAVKSLEVVRRSLPLTTTRCTLRLRSGGLDFNAAQAFLTDFFVTRGIVYALDPATGLPWELAAVNNLEVGARSGSNAATSLTAAGATVLFVR